jgi:hypothetical protein
VKIEFLRTQIDETTQRPVKDASYSAAPAPYVPQAYDRIKVTVDNRAELVAVTRPITDLANAIGGEAEFVITTDTAEVSQNQAAPAAKPVVIAPATGL